MLIRKLRITKSQRKSYKDSLNNLYEELREFVETIAQNPMLLEDRAFVEHYISIKEQIKYTQFFIACNRLKRNEYLLNRLRFNKKKLL